jgi:DNA (cytosine-5)-methyltransferase 1
MTQYETIWRKNMSLLTIKEVMEILNISRSTVYRMIKKGTLNPIRPTGKGGKILIREKDVKDLITSENIPNKKYKVISLFSGAGGMDLGFEGGFNFLGRYYHKNNFEVVYAVDINPHAVRTYNSNLNKVCALDDVTKIDVRSLPDADVVIGGFPCQDFSVAGKRGGIKVHRGKLYKSMVRVVEEKKPLVFVAENVRGLLSANRGLAIDVITKDFASASVGYRINMRVLNAADYGVPQRRERVIFVGVRKDIELAYEYPPKTNCAPLLTKELGLSPWITAQDALKDLESQERLLLLPNNGYSKAKKNKGQGNNRINPNRPSPTIRSEHHGNIEFHYKLDRRLSVREAARLQSFPDDFIFEASTSQAYKLVGNAVPPVLAWHIAKSVEDFLSKAIRENQVSIASVETN